MKKIILCSAFFLTGIIAQAQGTLLYQVEANWEAVSDNNATLRVEDFAGGPAFYTICGPVISSDGNNCFAPGELQPDFEIRRANNNDVAYLEPGLLGQSQTEPLIFVPQIVIGEYLLVNFDTSIDNVSRVSFDVFAGVAFNSNMANIRVFDTTGALLTTLNATLTIDDYTFVGIQSSTAIGRVEIEDAGNSIPLPITDLRYGVTRANDEANASPPLTVGEEFDDNDIVSSNVFATDSSVFSAPVIVDASCANYEGSDVWFSFTVPSNGNIIVETRAESGSALTDTGMALYNNTGVELDCDDDDGEGNHSLISLENLTPGQVLYVRVWAYNAAQNGQFRISAYSEEVLGINDTNTVSISHYPNPTNGMVNFKATTAISTIEVFNILGQKVIFLEHNETNETQIDLSNQPAGVYIANVATETGKESIRIIKQ